MRGGGLLCLQLLLLLSWRQFPAFAFSYHAYANDPYGGGFHGAACSPPYGFRRNSCGPTELISRRTEPACRRGPNVCTFIEIVRTNQSEYRYGESCGYVLSGYHYVRQCSYICRPTSKCLNELQEFERTYDACCPNFNTRAPDHDSYHEYYSHYAYYTPIHRDPVGCPIAVADTLLGCLELHGLSEFISYIEETVYIQLLNSTDMPFTVFAPTNQAILAARAAGLISVPTDPTYDIETLVGNHLVGQVIQHSDLESFGTKIYRNLEATNLHRVAVSFSDYSAIGYYYSNSQPLGVVVRPFINGAQIVVEDACKTVNGSLQIIDKVLMPSAITIREYLELRSGEFSNFTFALDSVNLLQFLDNPNVSRTVFAVPNDAFSRSFPPALFTCLTNYMRRPLNDLLLFHIGNEAHYNASLALEDFFYTLALKFLRVNLNRNTGVVRLGPDRVRVTQPDMPALNGVIHVIDSVLIPANFNYGMCAPFVPEPRPTPPLAPSPTLLPSPTVAVAPSTSPLPTVRFRDYLYDDDYGDENSDIPVGP